MKITTDIVDALRLIYFWRNNNSEYYCQEVYLIYVLINIIFSICN